MGKYILSPMSEEAVQMLLLMKQNCEDATVYDDPMRERKKFAIDYAISAIKYADEDINNGSIVPQRG